MPQTTQTTADQARLFESFNKQVATFNVLYTKLHHYHWQVKGPHFFTLHAKFEELYQEVAGYMDEVAERLLTIGGKPIGTLQESLEYSLISEAVGHETADQMIETLSRDLSLIGTELQEAIKHAEILEDDVTADLFVGIRSSLDKHGWMLEAYLGK